MLSRGIFEEQQLQQFGFSQGEFLTSGQCRMTDWAKDKMAGPVWDYIVWTCLHLHWYGASGPSNGGRQTQDSLTYLHCNYSALCCKHRAQFKVSFHYYSFVFVGVCTSVCVWERTRRFTVTVFEPVWINGVFNSCISLQEVGLELHFTQTYSFRAV